MPLTTFLNGRPVTQLRGIAWLALSENGQVGRGSFVSDGGGGGTHSWSYGGTVPCRIDPIGGAGMDEVLVADRIDDRSTHVVTVPAGTDVNHNDRFLMVGRGTYEVTAVRTRTAEWATHFETIQVT